MDKNLLKKIVLLNQTTLDSLAKEGSATIIKNFTKTGIKILEADFGFAWWKLHEDEEYKLIYKSPGTPYEPTIPRARAGNYIALKTKKPFYDSEVKKENYLFPIRRYLKSYVIVPIHYNDNIYGSLVFCFKEKHIFKEEEKGLLISLGNTAAQTITIHRFMEREREFALLKETAMLLEQEKLKTEFIANATHEIRTPLAIIRGNVDLALIKGLGSKNILKAINHEIDHLSSLLSDLTLLISDTAKTKNKITFKKVNLSKIIDHTASSLKIIADKKNISFKIKKIPDVILSGNEIYLERLFVNLLKNAITYGKENGWIKIEMAKKENIIEIKISDNGIGITEKDLSRIFDRFYRADSSHTFNAKSVGLGLAIVKWIVLAHNGNIKAESQEGQGATFTISLPVSN